ncbi:nucleotidyltransferase substrate binding protein [Treponema primitia]|uniref:nucleotidyltransferase substrate binding protein n=1 Tax=Treponema primitia TaxID=88058 RepID=UPI0002554D21|nr:nucleotidyltransferase substrate binding protein [Treponema primitia]
MIDYGKFDKALNHLASQYQNYSSLSERPDLGEIDREAIAESVIQRFAVCYDCLWKVLKRYLGENLGVPELPNSPKPLFRIAFENQLFPAVEPWLLYADIRAGTSHDYSENKAREALAAAGNFINDAAALYQKMTGKSWPLAQ